MENLANISLNVIILLLSIAVVLLLYFFLWQVLRVITRDLRANTGDNASDQVSMYGQLVILSSGPTGIPVGKVFPLSPVTSIGRSMECDVALNDTFLSGEHARLELRGDEWTLEDLRSTNGTFLNGLEVRDPTIVNEGDVVRIGRVELKLVR
jgi:hypothetical protein